MGRELKSRAVRTRHAEFTHEVRFGQVGDVHYLYSAITGEGADDSAIDPLPIRRNRERMNGLWPLDFRRQFGVGALRDVIDGEPAFLWAVHARHAAVGACGKDCATWRGYRIQ